MRETRLSEVRGRGVRSQAIWTSRGQGGWGGTAVRVCAAGNSVFRRGGGELCWEV